MGIGLLPPRYVEVSELGEGSFAVVYAAIDSHLDRRVAVKLSREALDAGSRLRFEREVRIAALLEGHPRVVTVHDAGEWGGRRYLVMERLAGTVADRLAEGRPPAWLAFRWLAQAAEALDFVHSQGVVHRDVKPANLLLDKHGDVRLGDFGIASVDGDGHQLTLTGEVVGTPCYLAPEVARGEPASPASDRYALARVARELLGKHPALRRGLAEDPGERYPTAAALVDAIAGRKDWTLLPSQPTRRLPRLARTKVAAPPAPRSRHHAVRLGPVVALLAAVAAVSAVASAYATARFRLQQRPAPARAVVRPVTCAVSSTTNDANLVVGGIGANAFCASAAHTLALDGGLWIYRSGNELYRPDTGAGELGLVCRLHRGALRMTVYDAGHRDIGRHLCGWYAGGGWLTTA